MSRTLWEIDAALDALPDDADADPVIDQWFAELNAALLEERAEKIDGYAALIQQNRAIAKARRDEAQRLIKRANTDDALADRLASRLLDYFRSKGIGRFNTRRYRLSVANNGGAQPVHLRDGIDPATLPDQFRTVRYVVNSSAVREALESGELLEFAELRERGQHLRIG